MTTNANAAAIPSVQWLSWGRWLRSEAVSSVVAAVAVLLAWLLSGRGYFWPRWVWFALALPLAAQYSLRLVLPRYSGRQRWFAAQAALTVVYLAMDFAIWALSGGGFFWPVFSSTAVLLLLGANAWTMSRAPAGREQQLVERVNSLSRTRSGALDVQAAELKRIERDLHDGAQARMVSLGMNLGLAAELLETDPKAVAALLAEARSTTLSALQDLRNVMEGIQPPVLADRGLVGALQALALDLSLPVTVTAPAEFPTRLPAPVESALYFAVSECLANIVKHSRATHASVTMAMSADVATATVTDDGVGGARLQTGSGLRGIARRLEVFDGTITVHSPSGGPTEISMEVPCESSSPKTSRYSATD